MHVHVFAGCRGTPLASYLKAVGILRVLSAQRDPRCRGAWRHGRFLLASELDLEGIKRFFLQEYAPTALVSPWNRGSGFFDKSNPHHDAIVASAAPRFAPYREAILASRALLTELQEADRRVRDIKDEAKRIKDKKEREALRKDPEYVARLRAAEKRFKSLKESFIPLCRKVWRGSHLEWLTAAAVVAPDGSATYPALLGSGGNDGRLDFTKHFLARIADLFDLEDGAPRPEAAPWLDAALLQAAEREHDNSAPVGQFLPAAAGGINMGTGMDSQSAVNPWDFVLALEGAVAFAPAATRRLNSQETVGASAPFALYSRAVGSGSLSATEESSRGEQWMPLWAGLATFPEVRTLFREGRVRNGKRAAADPLEMVLAIGRLGTVRGVDAFERYCYLERNGQNNLAVATGQIPVRLRPQVSLAEDLSGWVRRLQRAAREKDAPARLKRVERNLSDAIFDLVTHDPTPSAYQRVLLCAVEVEKVQLHGTARVCGPIPRLSGGWVEACDDGSAEFRLARALGATAALGAAGTLRPLFGPLDEWGSRYVEQSSRHVAHGRDVIGDLLAVVLRRAVEARQAMAQIPDGTAGRLPIVAARGWGARLEDLAAWCAGTVDAQRCVDLARGMLAVDWRQALPASRGQGETHAVPPEAFLAIRLCAFPGAVGTLEMPPLDMAMLRRLGAGDVTGAVESALRRLQGVGIQTALRQAIATPEVGRRWGAALAFPIEPSTAFRIHRRIALVQPDSETRAEAR